VTNIATWNLQSNMFKNWVIFATLVLLLSLAIISADAQQSKRKRSLIRPKRLKRLINKVDRMYQRSLEILTKMNKQFHCPLESCKKKIARRKYSLKASYNRFLKRLLANQDESLRLIKKIKQFLRKQQFRAFVRRLLKKGYKLLSNGLKSYHKACCSQNEACCEKKVFAKLTKQFKSEETKTRELIIKLSDKTKRLMKRRAEEAAKLEQQIINAMAVDLYLQVKSRLDEIQEELRRKNLMLFKDAILKNEKKVRKFISKVQGKKLREKLQEQLDLLVERNRKK
jgi:ribosomal protein S6